MTTPVIHHVSERLPPQGQRVLAYGRSEVVFKAWYIARWNGDFWFTTEALEVLRDVTHWTELLPEPQSAWSESYSEAQK